MRKISIFVIPAVIILAILGFIVSQKSLTNLAPPPPAGGSQSLSNDPKYKQVKEKYNLSEEQLQILSTVNPD